MLVAPCSKQRKTRIHTSALVHSNPWIRNKFIANGCRLWLLGFGSRVAWQSVERKHWLLSIFDKAPRYLPVRFPSPTFPIPKVSECLLFLFKPIQPSTSSLISYRYLMIPVLPSDIFFVIFGYLRVQDILNARQVDTVFVVFVVYVSWRMPTRLVGTFMRSQNHEVFGIG